MGFRAEHRPRRHTAVLSMDPLLNFCPYCGALPKDPCRQTMLDGRPVTDIHQMRFTYPQESD